MEEQELEIFDVELNIVLEKKGRETDSRSATTTLCLHSSRVTTAFAIAFHRSLYYIVPIIRNVRAPDRSSLA